ncbi:Hypothetical_protein [Hexamita inflata]|uniref:Hypothetical_protein n=1 Tax=Hexamita inflata TaxID=28002 RepID=A0AA86V015_9EUKA|nr:Hypothetical protein HINF_LOCUS58517 [Hexamita inflata]
MFKLFQVQQQQYNIYIYIKPVKSQPKVGPNEQKTITDAKQETEPILTKAPKLGICKIKQTKKDPRYLIKLMKQCIKGNHHQAMQIQRNNLPCKPKEITSKEKLRRENQFLKLSQRIRQNWSADDSVRTLLGLY